MRAVSATGKLARWTLSGADGSAATTRFWYISSAKKGVSGAMSLLSVTRQVYNVS